MTTSDLANHLREVAFVAGERIKESTSLYLADAALRHSLKSTWRPIAELDNIYQQPLWIASPKLIHADANPLGIAEGYWQDTEDPNKGEWRTTQFDMCNDEWNTISLNKEDVTHFLIPQGPWSAEELEKLER